METVMDLPQELVEAMARAQYEVAAAMCPGDDTWDAWGDMDADMREHWYEEARAGLEAALAPSRIECGTCGGTGDGFDPAEGTPFGGGMYAESCPTCEGRRWVSGPPLLLLRDQLEQVGWWAQYEHQAVVDDELHPNLDGLGEPAAVPLFVVIP